MFIKIFRSYGEGELFKEHHKQCVNAMKKQLSVVFGDEAGGPASADTAAVGDEEQRHRWSGRVIFETDATLLPVETENCVLLL